ncbi:hypothetical protein TWF481_010902 [Arthrobotrys musiformis]|uniref:Uncharacterized protein n=1 Tax=Arthrobotrys musiformis TaxID=47236 RepID=A0AAV9VWR5_9PEZI
MQRWGTMVLRALLFCLSAHDAVGLVITALPKGKEGANIPNLRLCKHNTQTWQMESILDGYDPGLSLVDPRDRGCPDGVPGWHWELAPKMETSTGETLIQLTGGAYDSGIGGITNNYEPEERLHFGILQPGKIYRSEFRVKRNGVYQKLDKNAPDDFIQVGDTLEFYGPSNPNSRQLYLKSVFQLGMASGLYELVRAPIQAATYGALPPVELRVSSLGFTEIIEPYGKNEADKLQEDISHIDKATELNRLSKPRFGFCGVGRICKAAAEGVGRLLGRRRRQGPTIEIPPLNMDDGPVDGMTDPFSSHRRLQPEYQAISRDTSIFIPQGEDDILEDDIFEPRVSVSQLKKPSIFKQTILQKENMDQILEQIEAEDFGTYYTLGGEGGVTVTAPAVDISSDVAEEDIPNELLVPPPNLYPDGIGSFDQLHTPEFRSGELAIDSEQPRSDAADSDQLVPQGQGGDEETAMLRPNSSTGLNPAPIKLKKMSKSRRDLADKRYEIYANCVQGFLKFPNDEPDEEVQTLVDRGWGVYSIMDFYQATKDGKSLPPCPKSRQDIINLAIDQGHPRYVAPGATGANPQSGIGAAGM